MELRQWRTRYDLKLFLGKLKVASLKISFNWRENVPYDKSKNRDFETFSPAENLNSVTREIHFKCCETQSFWRIYWPLLCFKVADGKLQWCLNQTASYFTEISGFNNNKKRFPLNWLKWRAVFEYCDISHSKSATSYPGSFLYLEVERRPWEWGAGWRGLRESWIKMAQDEYLSFFFM